jgi:hypothetical protein
VTDALAYRSTDPGPTGEGATMEPNEIFELIVKADEKIKYATPAKGDLRAKQAADLLAQAITEAEAIGNDALVQQAKVRLADLDSIIR